ncbi:sensor histidine kinase [Trinickia diaoshuihuensis]|uniref:sensor histidine kinase n=1 Tax=Trinickia diaoshuihuensis TaxID=2292265 RepID=UPI000E281176|nr:sensor histidine kinase [Trinickia diaoshuihuensis]
MKPSPALPAGVPALATESAAGRTLALAARLVEEQERRVEQFEPGSKERQAAEGLLAALRTSLTLCRRYQFVAAPAAAPLPARDDWASAGRTQAVREQERKRIAQELHDDLGQQLNALGLTAQRVERLAGSRAHSHPLNTAIRDLQAQIESALTSIRRMTRQLRPLALETLGFPGAIECLAAEFANRSNIRLACRFRVDDIEVSEAAATAIFRIVQEALTNVARHARARMVTVDFYRDGDSCSLRIADDGIGEAPDAGRRRRASLGLPGIAERAAQFDGTVSIRTGEGAGFALIVRMPVAAISARS